MLAGVDESAGTPYLTGLVSPVPERAGADPERVAAANEVAEATTRNFERLFNLPAAVDS